MHKAQVVIVGGGLSGLYAANLLTRKGILDWVLLEARGELGGRILSVAAGGIQDAGAFGTIDRFDLGPSWFWPGYQRQLDLLVQDLGLERFEQHEVGDTVVERSPQQPPARMRGYTNSPPSMRLVGGMGALTDALAKRLDGDRIHLGQTVSSLRVADADTDTDGAHVQLDSVDKNGRVTTWRAEHVLLAMPPRLVAHRMAFTPEFPTVLAQRWRDTPTWMAPHAKYVAIYDKPFWRDQGLSGEARSNCGPMGEIHDASMPGGSAALFGFLGVPAHVRNGVADDVLRTHCRAQFVRLFGPEAAAPKLDLIKDWAQDFLTSTDADGQGMGEHPSAPPATVGSGPWRGRLTGIGSEWSSQFPGYLAGAVDATSAGVHALISHRSQGIQ